MARIQIYETDYCGYCRAAKQLLDKKRLAYVTHDVTHDPARRKWLIEVTGRRTVPQIFIDGQPVGGYTELRDLDRRGELDRLLEAAAPT